LIVDVPLNGFIEAAREILARFPIELALREGRIDRVTAVVTLKGVFGLVRTLTSIGF
jgi:hypothetical protein